MRLNFFGNIYFCVFPPFVNLLSESLLISGLRAFSISIFFIAARVQVVSGALRALRNVPCNYKENWYNAHLQIRISKDSENKFRRWIPKTFGWRKKGFPWGTVREGNSDIFTYVPWEHKLPFFYFDSPGSKVSIINFDNAKRQSLILATVFSFIPLYF